MNRTPGPWKCTGPYVRTENGNDSDIICKLSYTIEDENGELHSAFFQGDDHCHNGLLLAASPNLLAALEAAWAELFVLWREAETGENKIGPSETVMVQIESAIAEAKPKRKQSEPVEGAR